MDFGALDASVLATFREPERILYGPQFQPDFEITGILDRYMVDVPGAGDGPPVTVAKATLSLRAADLPPGFTPKARDRVLIRDVTYDVTTEVPADAAGWIVLPLGRVA
ncbi:hypothetical protein HB662_02220 [Roseomonas frigidaquae]|uniref:Head-tail adaptor protein n=1 Tax=Falsiroseomonas frigidaquae TaxID=487318 RepID=A0ABX1EST5_9PROT|nr:hypothetical protein [Falsiroseomonas frigidaquae]NKE43575.1 hypothetical protein [Falsiroseomonas frigidaquae]